MIGYKNRLIMVIGGSLEVERGYSWNLVEVQWSFAAGAVEIGDVCSDGWVGGAVRVSGGSSERW